MAALGIGTSRRAEERDGASVPEQVNLTFTVSKSPTDSYQLTLTGQRRQTDVSTQPSP